MDKKFSKNDLLKEKSLCTYFLAPLAGIKIVKEFEKIEAFIDNKSLILYIQANKPIKSGFKELYIDWFKTKNNVYYTRYDFRIYETAICHFLNGLYSKMLTPEQIKLHKRYSGLVTGDDSDYKDLVYYILEGEYHAEAEKRKHVLAQQILDSIDCWELTKEMLIKDGWVIPDKGIEIIENKLNKRYIKEYI